MSTGVTINVDGYIDDRMLFAGLPLSYHQPLGFFRCHICESGVKSVTHHFTQNSRGRYHHPELRETNNAVRFALITAAYPERELHTRLSLFEGLRYPRHIPGTQTAESGFECQGCGHITSATPQMYAHLRKATSPSCESSDPVEHIQSINRSSWTLWFKSSPQNPFAPAPRSSAPTAPKRPRSEGIPSPAAGGSQHVAPQLDGGRHHFRSQPPQPPHQLPSPASGAPVPDELDTLPRRQANRVAGKRRRVAVSGSGSEASYQPASKLIGRSGKSPHHRKAAPPPRLPSPADSPERRDLPPRRDHQGNVSDSARQEDPDESIGPRAGTSASERENELRLALAKSEAKNKQNEVRRTELEAELARSGLARIEWRRRRRAEADEAREAAEAASEKAQKAKDELENAQVEEMMNVEEAKVRARERVDKAAKKAVEEIERAKAKLLNAQQAAERDVKGAEERAAGKIQRATTTWEEAQAAAEAAKERAEGLTVKEEKEDDSEVVYAGTGRRDQHGVTMPVIEVDDGED